MRAASTVLRTRGRAFRRTRKWLAAIALIACSISSASAQEAEVAARKHVPSVYAALGEAPNSASTRTNPFDGNAREAIAGGKLFEQHCAECHGEKAGGTRRGPSLLRPEVRQATSGALFWILTNGVVRHGMPVWSKLPEPQRWQIITFLQSLGPQSNRPSAQMAH